MKKIACGCGEWILLDDEDLTIFLGNYATPKEAAIAYNEAASKYFGAYARLNEI